MSTIHHYMERLKLLLKMIDENELPYSDVSRTWHHWYPKWIIDMTQDPPMLMKRTRINLSLCTELIESEVYLPVARQHESIADGMDEIRRRYGTRWSSKFLEMLRDAQKYPDGWYDFLLSVAVDTAESFRLPFRLSERMNRNEVSQIVSLWCDWYTEKSHLEKFPRHTFIGAVRETIDMIEATCLDCFFADVENTPPDSI